QHLGGADGARSGRPGASPEARRKGLQATAGAAGQDAAGPAGRLAATADRRAGRRCARGFRPAGEEVNASVIADSIRNPYWHVIPDSIRNATGSVIADLIRNPCWACQGGCPRIKSGAGSSSPA